MNAIWKYEVGQEPIPMPLGARILHAHTQGGGIYVWALVDTTAPLKPRRVWVMPTGREFNAGSDVYIGTVHLPTGLVFHVFEPPGDGEAPP